MLVDPIPEQSLQDLPKDDPKSALVSWILSNVDPWRSHRDANHKAEWDEYYRMWRAKWAPEDQNRKSERSKVITPATMQAVDSTVAEIEEAIFGREQWIDIDEDVKQRGDPAKVQAMLQARDNLLERLEHSKVPANVAKAVLIGTIWGTGIGKINTYTKTCKKISRDEEGRRLVITEQKVCNELIPLEPYEFIPDPTTDDIDEMLGCAHETVLPLHRVQEMIRDGVYFKDSKISSYSGEDMPQGPKLAEQSQPSKRQGVWVIEWHGKVPANYLMAIEGKMPLETAMEGDPDENLVEAICTIGNKSTLLGAKRNPFYMEDRSIIAYQHDTIPSYFWGRGAPEKASNSQRTLDATVRARIDAMAIVANPMVAGDVTRLPRNFNLGVWPGKFWPTSGNPDDVLRPFQFGTINPELFSHAQDMERMVSTATGAMDPSAEFSPNGQSATNTALNSSAFIKRAKRAMKNIERNFLRPMVQKFMWRYMQFVPDEFPEDYDFNTRAALGVMAREFEQQQLIQLLSIVPNESKPFMMLLKAVFDNSSSPHKAAMVGAIDELVNPPPPTPEQQAAAKAQEELKHRADEATVSELEGKAMKAKADAELSQAKAQQAISEIRHDAERLRNEDHALELEYMRAATEVRKVAGLEQQNAESDLSAHIRAQQVALQGLSNGIGADRILGQASKLVAAAKEDMGITNPPHPGDLGTNG